ncbi:Hypothetical_protein [Hexamita inflata]|uniref:Hypothetical_protein n=1 Tax=Hexamita inflata TaxID=28002 RepID=A0AA86R238_9EUKA|nr:Hypothetical protein HINF_LOCUS57919 [Hexamita inflata]
MLKSSEKSNWGSSSAQFTSITWFQISAKSYIILSILIFEAMTYEINVQLIDDKLHEILDVRLFIVLLTNEMFVTSEVFIAAMVPFTAVMLLSRFLLIWSRLVFTS